MLFVLIYKMHVKRNVGMLFRLCLFPLPKTTSCGHNCNRPVCVCGRGRKGGGGVCLVTNEWRANKRIEVAITTQLFYAPPTYFG
jgi:hypothetical protein